MSPHATITAADLARFFESQGFRKMPLNGVKELVWGQVMKHDGRIFSLRICSGVETSGRLARDTIRIEVWYRGADSKPLRVGNVEQICRDRGWDTSLLNLISKWHLLLGPPCPNCGEPMVRRTAKKGKSKGREFYGCSSWKPESIDNCGGFRWVRRQDDE